MWQWISLCLALTVIDWNYIIAAETSDTQERTKCANDEVLVKIWTILADLLDADGISVKVPSRDHIQYALTLIKKSILDDDNIPNTRLKEKLFLREAELAKYKGVYLYDKRPLQTLLELYPKENSDAIFKYELSTNDKQSCREAFKELFQTTHLNYNILANSPACSTDPVVQYSIHNPGYANQAPQLHTNFKDTRSNDIMNFGPAWNEYNNVGGLMQNLNPLLDLTKGIGSAQIPVLNPNEEKNILHAVNLTKNTSNLIGHDFTEDIKHAKNVADRINYLYQSYNIPTQPITTLSSYPKRLLREPGSSFGAVNIQMQNNALNTPLYSSWPIKQTSYGTQNQVNPQNNSVNESYTFITNRVHSQVPVAEATYLNQENVYPFVNFKYHPNFAHDNEALTKVNSNTLVENADILPQINSAPSNVKYTYNLHPYPNQNMGKQTEASQHLEQVLYKIPLTSNLQSDMRPNNYLKYNGYSHPQPEYKNILQNNANSQYNDLNSLKFNYNTNSYQYNSQVHSLPTSYSKYGYNKYMFRQPAMNQENNNLFTYKYHQNIPDTVISQKLITSISPRFPPNYKVNMHTKPFQSYAYSGVNIQKNNVPVFTPTSNYNGVIYNTYNGQPVIDKLADWVSVTNAAKLNQDNDEAEVELTFLIKKTPQSNSPAAFYIKFRMPYGTFAKRLSNFLTMQSLRTGSSDTDLYENLASGHNATIIPSQAAIPEEDLNNSEDKVLVRATYIEPNEPGKDNAVDIINLVKEPEQIQENIRASAVPVNFNVQVPMLRN